MLTIGDKTFGSRLITGVGVKSNDQQTCLVVIC